MASYAWRAANENVYTKFKFEFDSLKNMKF